MTPASRGTAGFAPTRPDHIAVSKSGGIKIDWRDGHRSEYAIQYLRDRCPCSTCSGAHGGAHAKPEPAASPFQMYKPTLKMLDVERVGNYALRIKWNDGHDTGIYSWGYLRTICPCAVCVGVVR